MSPGGVIGIVVAVIVVFAIVSMIVSYNRFKSQQNLIAEAWKQIDVELQRRFDLIPNLVEAVKGYAAHERETFEEVTQARAQAEQAPGPSAAADANEHLGGALNRLIAVSEAYPQLRASENFLALQQELADIEDKLAAARRYYNQTVYRYHSVMQSFPPVLIAKPFGFHEREFFGTDERDAPVVSFAQQ